MLSLVRPLPLPVVKQRETSNESERLSLPTVRKPRCDSDIIGVSSWLFLILGADCHGFGNGFTQIGEGGGDIDGAIL